MVFLNNIATPWCTYSQIVDEDPVLLTYPIDDFFEKTSCIGTYFAVFFLKRQYLLSFIRICQQSFKKFVFSILQTQTNKQTDRNTSSPAKKSGKSFLGDKNTLSVDTGHKISEKIKSLDRKNYSGSQQTNLNVETFVVFLQLFCLLKFLCFNLSLYSQLLLTSCWWYPPSAWLALLYLALTS